MGLLTSILAFTVVPLSYVLLKIWKRRTLGEIPGPEPESFLMGNLAQLHGGRAAEADFMWQAKYGGIARIKAPFGVDMLWISDPKALQYVIQTSGYNFPKQPERRAISRLLTDHGLSWAEGDTHRRQRKVMLPAFGGPETKALLPVFEQYAEQVTLRWKELLESITNHSAIVNVINDIQLATLDAIGEAAFDYKMGCMENSESELAQEYSNLMIDIFSRPSRAKLFFTSVAHYIPVPISDFMYDHLPSKGLARARKNRDVAHRIAHNLLERKSEALQLGKGGRDVMSILVRANNSENEQTRLSHLEMISQMRTILLAGQETTSNTLSFGLYELAKQPIYQERLRAEIRIMEQGLQGRGDVSLTARDMDAMPYLQAVVREILRFHPVVPHIFRQTGKDDVIPLSKPLTLRSGEVVNEVPVPKGTRLVLSNCGYNRDKDVWGEDAHSFNPERFLENTGKRGPTVGVFGNVLTFSGGVRACIGWRFAVYEIEAFLIQLISNFEFELTDESKRMRRENVLAMVPTIEGEVDKGVRMPLKVSLASRD